MKDVPTHELYQQLNEAFEHFNQTLFEGALPPVIITVQRGLRTRGQFAPDRWAAEDGARAHEIAINPAHLTSNSLLELFQTIVREQVHCWQYCFGKAGRRGYQNAEFRDKMLELGLQTSDTGEPNGRQMGQSLLSYPIKGAKFFRAAAELIDQKKWAMPWVDRECRASATSESIVHWALPSNADDEGGEREPSEPPALALKSADPVTNDDDIELAPVNADASPADEIEHRNDSDATPSPRPRNDTKTDAEAPLRALHASLPDVSPEAINTLVGGRVADLLPATADIVIKESAPAKPKPRTKVKYECGCGSKVWGKPDLDIQCNSCGENFMQEKIASEPPNTTSDVTEAGVSEDF